MDIFKIIRDESCTIKLSAKSKDECILKLSELLAKGVPGMPADMINQALRDREKIGSTGFEEGVAIPHAKIAGLDDFYMSIAFSRKGVPFESVDGKKAHIFFTIIGPDEKPEEHLQILAQISRIARNPNARLEMKHARSVTALKEAFLRYVSAWDFSKLDVKKSKLLMIILYEKRFLDDILELFLERGIRGVNVLESTGIKDQLSTIPLFGDFLDFLGERSDVSKTIMTIVPENEVAEIIQGIEEIVGDLDKHTGAMVMALDLFMMKGSLEI